MTEKGDSWTEAGSREGDGSPRRLSFGACTRPEAACLQERQPFGVSFCQGPSDLRARFLSPCGER